MITVTTRPFGALPDGRAVTAYTIANGAGMRVTALDYGAILQSVCVPAAAGPVDVVLGYPTLEGYLVSGGYLGALVGRNANRLGGAFIEIDGKRWPVTANEGKKQLHGGLHGFNEKLFSAREVEGGVAFSCLSPDGEEGFPGEVSLTATYTLDETGALTLDYRAAATRDTVVEPHQPQLFQPQRRRRRHGAPAAHRCGRHHRHGRRLPAHRRADAGGGHPL